MSNPTQTRPRWDNGYPTTTEDILPESDWHRKLMLALISSLAFFFHRQRVYVSGNLLVFYDREDRLRHVSPDVFVVRNLEPQDRPNYLIWEEGISPEFIIELASRSTCENDRTRKFTLYRDVLRVPELFLFDPVGGLYEPRLQGYRLVDNEYVPIKPVNGRLPSEITGLHLEQNENELRLWDPQTDEWVPTDEERAEQEATRAEAEAARAEAEAARAEQEAAARRTAQARADAEVTARIAAEERIRELEAELARLRNAP